MGLFDGKVALVTGGSSGIGQATAIAFAREGAKVALTYHSNRAGGDETVRLIEEHDGHAILLQTDVAKASEVQALVDATVATYGRLDFAFNNAGTGVGKLIHETTEEEWDRVVNTNLKGVWLCMKYELPVMMRQGHGVIVNNSSIGGITFMAFPAVYRATKHGVVSLSKSAAAAYRSYGIRVNVVCPGNIRTPMWSGVARFLPAEYEAWLIHEQLLGDPEDIAKAVVWLCSDDASFIRGHALVIDGGLIISQSVRAYEDYRKQLSR
jgi:NAD(P)-dependent dehydrogenase (short-subunit alcohol dehydrogenase family)